MAERYARYAEDLCKGISSVQDGNLHADLFDCLRADARRFAAYKAHHVQQTMQRIEEDKTYKEQEKAQAKQRAAHLFDLWQTTERGMAIASAQMADKWESFAEDGDAYYLQYRTARDEKVRAEHQVLDGTTLPMSDPFWKSYYPPLGWNCRCNVVQVHKDKHKPTNSANACQAGEMITRKQPSFRFNPGIEKRCFPKTVSYYKRAGRNRTERDRTEKQCEALYRDYTMKHCTSLLNKTTTCNIDGKSYNVIFNQYEIKEYAQAMFQDIENFWLKNEILHKMPEYIRNATYKGYKVVDATHNKNKKRRQFKSKLDIFAYFECTLPNGNTVCLHLCRYRESRNYSLYYISNNPPKNIITENAP